MKLITDILNFLITLLKSWKFIYHIVLISLAILTRLFKFGTKTIQFNLPLWIILIISILTFFPFVNFFVYLLNQRKISYKKLYGLFWKKPLLPFLNPKPYCPHKNCGHQVIQRFIPPKIYQAISSISDINNIDYEGHYFYECPIHGQLNGIPNEDITVLQKKARIALRKE